MLFASRVKEMQRNFENTNCFRPSPVKNTEEVDGVTATVQIACGDTMSTENFPSLKMERLEPKGRKCEEQILGRVVSSECKPPAGSFCASRASSSNFSRAPAVFSRAPSRRVSVPSSMTLTAEDSQDPEEQFVARRSKSQSSSKAIEVASAEITPWYFELDAEIEEDTIKPVYQPPQSPSPSINVIFEAKKVASDETRPWSFMLDADIEVDTVG